ncbi:excalibur calcium-binding domain-containing protein [Hydrogenophaga sp.]|uniref:excalibur calcium-binding domain-containing protein n=1 Tax=Hydrogenophaga sp. TaxID=1904254 RepID=UPI003D0D359E
MPTTSTRFNGTLKTWDIDRGFGFVVAEHGEGDLFVHVSAFPRDGRHPRVGEPLSFEIEPGKDGRKRAVRVQRLGSFQAEPSTHERERPTDAQRRRHLKRTEPASSSPSLGALLIAALVVAVLGWWGYGAYRGFQAERSLKADTPQGAMAAPAPSVAAPPRAPAFQCDGRQHCSQMTSCSEATFFLRNCPGTKMDGDGDGVPCEQQLCGG